MCGEYTRGSYREPAYFMKIILLLCIFPASGSMIELHYHAANSHGDYIKAKNNSNRIPAGEVHSLPDIFNFYTIKFG